MMKLTILLLLGFYSAEASPTGYKVEEYAEDAIEEEDEDWSASALVSAKAQSEKENKKYLSMMQQAEFAEEREQMGKEMTEADVSEFAELAEEDSSIAQMNSKLTKLEKMASLQKRWTALAEELHAARVEEFMDGLPQMPKTLLGLEAEVARLENVKKMELGAEQQQQQSAPVKSTNLLQVKSSAIVEASAERRVSLARTEVAALKGKVEAAEAAVAESMRILEKAERTVESAQEALADSEKLWEESEKEVRGRDRLWAQKERAHLEQEYQTIAALKDNAEKQLWADQHREQELSGQQMLSTVSLAMQEAHAPGATASSFAETLKTELDKNELAVEDFLRYAKQEKKPEHLAGWGLFKTGPTGMNAAPLASALKQLDSSSTADELSAKLFDA